MFVTWDTCSLMPYEPYFFLLSFPSPMGTFVSWLQPLQVLELAAPPSRCRWLVLMIRGSWDEDMRDSFGVQTSRELDGANTNTG